MDFKRLLQPSNDERERLIDGDIRNEFNDVSQRIGPAIWFIAIEEMARVGDNKAAKDAIVNAVLTAASTLFAAVGCNIDEAAAVFRGNLAVLSAERELMQQLVSAAAHGPDGRRIVAEYAFGKHQDMLGEVATVLKSLTDIIRGRNSDKDDQEWMG